MSLCLQGTSGLERRGLSEGRCPSRVCPSHLWRGGGWDAAFAPIHPQAAWVFPTWLPAHPEQRAHGGTQLRALLPDTSIHVCRSMGRPDGGMVRAAIQTQKGPPARQGIAPALSLCYPSRKKSPGLECVYRDQGPCRAPACSSRSQG